MIMINFDLVEVMGFSFDMESFPCICIHITFPDNLVQIDLTDMFDTLYEQHKKEIFFGMGI
jgi:hypothetical protein